jgi:hypothetical protein
MEDLKLSQPVNTNNSILNGESTKLQFTCSLKFRDESMLKSVFNSLGGKVLALDFVVDESIKTISGSVTFQTFEEAKEIKLALNEFYVGDTPFLVDFADNCIPMSLKLFNEGSLVVEKNVIKTKLESTETKNESEDFNNPINSAAIKKLPTKDFNFERPTNAMKTTSKFTDRPVTLDIRTKHLLENVEQKESFARETVKLNHVTNEKELEKVLSLSGNKSLFSTPFPLLTLAPIIAVKNEVSPNSSQESHKVEMLTNVKNDIWEEYLDTTSNVLYYYNPITQLTTWEIPSFGTIVKKHSVQSETTALISPEIKPLDAKVENSNQVQSLFTADNKIPVNVPKIIKSTDHARAQNINPSKELMQNFIPTTSNFSNETRLRSPHKVYTDKDMFPAYIPSNVMSHYMEGVQKRQRSLHHPSSKSNPNFTKEFIQSVPSRETMINFDEFNVNGQRYMDRCRSRNNVIPNGNMMHFIRDTMPIYRVNNTHGISRSMNRHKPRVNKFSNKEITGHITIPTYNDGTVIDEHDRIALQNSRNNMNYKLEKFPITQYRNETTYREEKIQGRHRSIDRSRSRNKVRQEYSFYHNYPDTTSEYKFQGNQIPFDRKVPSYVPYTNQPQKIPMPILNKDVVYFGTVSEVKQSGGYVTTLSSQNERRRLFFHTKEWLELDGPKRGDHVEFLMGFDRKQNESICKEVRIFKSKN